MRRALPALLLVAGALTACGSSDTPPQVTFAAGTVSVVARPTQYCDLQFTDCRNDATAPVTLAVPPGTPLRVTVPAEIESTPWQVVFRYRDATGAQQDERSRVFAPDSQGDYTLTLDTPTDRLLTAQVQQFGPPPQANPAGGIDFPIRGSWVLTAAA